MKYLFYLLIFLLLPFGLKADETTERMDTLRVYYCICKTEEVLQSVEARQLTATDSLYRSDTLEDELDESVILYLMAELAWGEDTLHPSNYGNQEAFELSLRQKAIDKLCKTEDEPEPNLDWGEVSDSDPDIIAYSDSFKTKLLEKYIKDILEVWNSLVPTDTITVCDTTWKEGKGEQVGDAKLTWPPKYNYNEWGDSMILIDSGCPVDCPLGTRASLPNSGSFSIVNSDMLGSQWYRCHKTMVIDSITCRDTVITRRGENNNRK